MRSNSRMGSSLLSLSIAVLQNIYNFSQLYYEKRLFSMNLETCINFVTFKKHFWKEIAEKKKPYSNAA